MNIIDKITQLLYVRRKAKMKTRHTEGKLDMKGN